MWRAVTNSLATMVNKKKRNLEQNSLCTICGTEEEDVAHALCRCPHAKYLWEAMGNTNAISCKPDSNWKDSDWILDISGRVSKEERMGLMMLLWRIWYVRNGITHGKAAIPVEVSQRFIISYMASLLEIRQHPNANLIKGKHVVQYGSSMPLPRQCKPSAESSSWIRPQEGWMKLNVDGSYHPSDGKGGTGAVLRDSSGNLIFAACGVLHRPASALEAEMVDCREGISMALKWTLLPIIVETDCLEMVQLIHSDEKAMSDLAFLIREVKLLLKGNREIVIKKVSRGQSRDCHVLANKGRCESLTAFWPDDNCNFIPHVLGADE